MTKRDDVYYIIFKYYYNTGIHREGLRGTPSYSSRKFEDMSTCDFFGPGLASRSRRSEKSHRSTSNDHVGCPDTCIRIEWSLIIFCFYSICYFAWVPHGFSTVLASPSPSPLPVRLCSFFSFSFSFSFSCSIVLLLILLGKVLIPSVDR